VWNHLKNKQRISELQEEIDHYTQSYNHDKARIRELNSNPKAIEKIARERYFMKCDDEDIFVLSDDERVPQRQEPVENMDDDERAE
jgi:cell division protein FtsB